MPAADSPFFVARDRARRVGRALARVLEERRIGWRGAAVGMAVLEDTTAGALDEAIEDLRRSRDDVLEGRIRDRERPLSDVPFAVLAHALAWRADLARRLDEGLRARRVPSEEGRRRFLATLGACLRRIDAFVFAYDEKRPIGVTRPTDVARVLEEVEEEAAWARGLPPPGPPRAFDRAPPPLPSEPNALEDLLVAVRAEAPDLAGPWRVTPQDGSRPLELVLGDVREGGPRADVPGPIDRAARVLAFDQPVEVRCAGGLGGLTGVSLRLTDLTGGSVSLTAAAAGGDAARLSPAAERAVRALASAPPLPQEGPAPPARLVALVGVLRALDAEVRAVLLPRVGTAAVRRAAGGIPRQATRKAPPRRDLLLALERDLPGAPAARVDALAAGAAAGRIGARALDVGAAALLLALFGRRWSAAGARLERSIDLGDWSDAEALETAADLLAVAAVRGDLEAGRSVPPVDLTRLERASVSVLGRLGRLGAPG